MAELICQSTLKRGLTANGVLQWSTYRKCAFAAEDGVMILDLTTTKHQKFAMSCDAVSAYSDTIQPFHVCLANLASDNYEHSDKIQNMKIDRILSPRMQAPGNHFAVRQVSWEPLSKVVASHPRLAVSAQHLLLYAFFGREWKEVLNVNQILSQYMSKGEHQARNLSAHATEQFKTNCLHIKAFTWACNSSLNIGNPCIMFSNYYGHMFVLNLSSPSSNVEIEIHRLDLGDIVTANITCLEWIQGESSLAIGRLDGTCCLVRINSEFTAVSSREIDLKVDYRAVQFLQNIGGDLLFVKHTQVLLYDIKRNDTRSFPVLKTKYSLSYATADSSMVYIATRESGVFIKDKTSGKLLHHIEADSGFGTCGLAVSPSSLLLLTLSQPPQIDRYVVKQPLSMKLYKLKSSDDLLQKAWNSDDATVAWDLRLLFAAQAEGLFPEWLVGIINSDSVDLSKYSPIQLRLLWLILSLLVARHPVSSTSSADILTRRRSLLINLKLLLTICHMRSRLRPDSELTGYVSKCERNSKVEDLTDWDLSFIFHKNCPICSLDLKPTANLTYVCDSGHSYPFCSHTLQPVIGVTSPACDQCGSRRLISINNDVICSLLADSCVYCGGHLELDRAADMLI